MTFASALMVFTPLYSRAPEPPCNRVIVRPHPPEGANAFEGPLHQLPVPATVSYHSTAEDLTASGVVVGLNSATLKLARICAMEVRTWIPNATRDHQWLPWAFPLIHGESE